MSDFVIPGEVLSTEEEFVPSEGTFVEAGNIYSTVIGRETKNDSRISIISNSRTAKPFKRGMAVLGLVTDDLRSVVFVKINTLRSGNSAYLALKSGKVISPRPDTRRGAHGQPTHATKPLKVGDIITALIIAEDKDVYTLSINMPEFGVVYAKCELCDTALDYNTSSRELVCSKCEHTEYKKVSNVYADVDAINEMLNKYTKQNEK